MTDCNHPLYHIMWNDEKLMCMNCRQEFVPKEPDCLCKGEYAVPGSTHSRDECRKPKETEEKCCECDETKAPFTDPRGKRFCWDCWKKPEAGEGKTIRVCEMYASHGSTCCHPPCEVCRKFVYSRSEVDERMAAMQSLLCDMESQICQSVPAIKDKSLFFYIANQVIKQLGELRSRFLP